MTMESIRSSVCLSIDRLTARIIEIEKQQEKKRKEKKRKRDITLLVLLALPSAFDRFNECFSFQQLNAAGIMILVNKHETEFIRWIIRSIALLSSL
jgi:DNA recombination-dependent growth factor C